MKLKLDKWQKDFNKNVYAGLAGGLLVYLSQIGIEEVIKLGVLPDIWISRIFGIVILSIILFIILALTPVFLKGGKKQKMNWWKLIVGFFGVVGVVSQMPTDFGSWLVGLAFLILLISSFFDRN